MINECAEVHTPWGKYPIDNCSQRYLALMMPPSRLNASNTPGALPCCNRQPLQNFTDWTKPWKLNTTKNFHANYLMWKFPDLQFFFFYTNDAWCYEQWHHVTMKSQAMMFIRYIHVHTHSLWWSIQEQYVSDHVHESVKPETSIALSLVQWSY